MKRSQQRAHRFSFVFHSGLKWKKCSRFKLLNRKLLYRFYFVSSHSYRYKVRFGIFQSRFILTEFNIYLKLKLFDVSIKDNSKHVTKWDYLKRKFFFPILKFSIGLRYWIDIDCYVVWWPVAEDHRTAYIGLVGGVLSIIVLLLGWCLVVYLRRKRNHAKQVPSMPGLLPGVLPVAAPANEKRLTLSLKQLKISSGRNSGTHFKF